MDMFPHCPCQVTWSLWGMQRLGIPKTILRFNNSLEDLQNSLNAITLTITVYYTKDYRLN